MKLVIGLGNPGKKYINTRHNIGFLVIDKMARENKIKLAKNAGLSAEVAENKNVENEFTLAKPLTFMNLSGTAVKALAKKYKVKTEDIIVIHDDADLDFGKIKVKTGGGSAGHNGVESIGISLQDKNFTRVRIGIGRGAEDSELADFVLSDWIADEKKQLSKIIDEAVLCLNQLIGLR